MLTPSEVLGLAPLSASAASSLPDSTPAPPWVCRVEALLWWHRAVPAAAEAAGAGPAGPLAGRRLSYVTVGAFVRYLDSPVGPYSEVFAAPVWAAGRAGLPSVTVPFIAVDSVPSIHGGRVHWALPKVLASFTWPTLSAVSAEGDGWAVSGSFSGGAPRLPIVGFLPCVQPFPDGSVGSSVVRQRGLARLGRLDVGVTGDAIAPWLLAGRHRCLQITHATMVVGPPR